MASRRPPASSRVTRLRAQTRAIRTMNGVLMCCCGLALGSLMVATALPQRQQLADKQAALERVLEKEREVLAEKEDKQAGYEALRHDREYLELHARDRLNLHREGEKIYRIERAR